MKEEQRYVYFHDLKVTAKDGLLWANKQVIDLPLADRIAEEHDFLCAERLVKFLEGGEE